MTHSTDHDAYLHLAADALDAAISNSADPTTRTRAAALQTSLRKAADDTPPLLLTLEDGTPVFLGDANAISDGGVINIDTDWGGENWLRDLRKQTRRERRAAHRANPAPTFSPARVTTPPAGTLADPNPHLDHAD